jgi:hypothetical protein
MFIKVIEVFAVVGAVIFIMYQVVKPAVTGRPLFPMFRSVPKAKEELAQANEDYDVAVVKQQIKKVRTKTTKKEI